MSRTLSAWLAWTALAAPFFLVSGCGSGPSSQEITLDLFNRIAFLFEHYNNALANQDPTRLEGVTSELRRVVAAHQSRILDGLSAPDPVLRADAAFALGFSKDRAAIAPLATATADPEISVRANAIASLGMLGFEDVPVAPFERGLEDPAREIRMSALFGLRPLVDETKDHGLLGKIHEKLADADVNVRNEALILLRKLRRKESVAVLLGKPIRDPDSLVRSNAALTLGVIGPSALGANPFLIEMLRDEDTKVVDSAWRALNRINEKDFDRSYPTWRDWYEDEQRHFYACLDHREIESAVAGECPICRKKLERLPKETGKKSDVPTLIYGCAEHPEVQTTVPAKCGKCGKDLIARRPDPGAYLCPEHPDVVTSTPAKCGRPGCGKDLVLRKPEVVSYTCPEHPDVVTSTPAKCGKPGCGKALVPSTKK
jgi:HEAT repeat protein